MKKNKIEEIRINKFIASAGEYSRRKADELILEGKVKVNGEKVAEPGIMVTIKDEVTINGKRIRPKGEMKCAVFYKPAGYITTKSDDRGRKTIYDILPQELHYMNPAGRLDRATTGLLILTNDGELLQKLTHPKIKIRKIYTATVEGKLTQDDFDKMQKGIEIEQGKIAYAEGCLLEYKDKQSTVELTLYQGYNRQIRRMMKTLGHPVVSLKRIAHANITLDGLEKGQFKYLKTKQIIELNNYIKKCQNAK